MAKPVKRSALVALIRGVPDQAAVYAADLAAARKSRASSSEAAKAPEDVALDGVAYYVFNTLRGTEDTVDGATFDEVRAVIAAKGGL